MVKKEKKPTIQNSSLARAQDVDTETAIEPASSPEEFGFPAKPNAAQVRCWAKQELFLDALARTGSIGAACSESGVGVPNAEFWNAKDTYGFKTRKAWALGLGEEGAGQTFEQFLGGNPQILSQQDLLGRLSSIGQGFGDVTGGEQDFLDTFTNTRARDLFKIGATTGIASRFRDPRRARLDREFDQFLLDNPLGSIIGEIGQGRFR